MTIPLSPKTQRELSNRRIRLKLLGRFSFLSRYHRMRREVLIGNALDYHRSRRLARALEQFMYANVTNYDAPEKFIGDEWRPYHVEHAPSGIINGSQSGHVSGGIFGSGSFDATMRGQVTPNLLDTSSTIFLKNAAGATMRAVIPSRGAAAAMIASTLEQWRLAAGRDYYWKGYEREWFDSHTSFVLHRFASSSSLKGSLIHLETIDSIHASCEMPLENRPVIKLQGEVTEPGVALVTALFVNDTKNVFLPTGFVNVIRKAINDVLWNAQPPKLIATA